jgi:phosphate transport system substrate-binding protein
MHPRKATPLFILLAGLIALSACAPAATSTPQVVIQTQPAQVVVQTQLVSVTATPGPAAPAAPTAMAPGSVALNGAGATFPLPLYTEWTYAYQYVDPSVAINYQGIGSGGGKKAIIDGTVDFAGSDSLVTDAEYTSGKDLQMLPAVAGAAVPIYNIKFNPPAKASGTGPTPTPAPIPALILDRQTLVDIFNAKVKTWNDAEIIKLNPGLKDLLPAAPITAVHRSDGSGTTEMFTKALTSFSPDWKAGGAQSVEWPVDKAGNGLGAKGNPGVAAAVLNTPNSIGYVELDYAIANSISYSQMVNKAGQTVTANGDSIISAMTDFASNFSDKLTNVIVDGPGAKSWPISGYTYYVVHMTSMKDCTKAQKLVQYIQWTLSDQAAAKTAVKLGYAVLPADVQKAVTAKLGEMKCNGQSVMTK